MSSETKPNGLYQEPIMRTTTVAPKRLIEISKRTHTSRVNKDRSDSMAEKVVAAGKVGSVTVRVQSRIPRRARGTFVPAVSANR